MGTRTHGLSPLGKEQARNAAPAVLEACKAHGVDPARLVAVSSDFTRARETAELAVEAIRELMPGPALCIPCALRGSVVVVKATGRMGGHVARGCGTC